MKVPMGENSVMAWTAHPPAEGPGMTALAVVIIALIGAAAGWSFGWLWAAGSVVVLVVSLNRYFFPSRFAIDDEGLTVGYLFRTQRVPWIQVRRFVADSRGGYLSSRAVSSRLDAYRGIHIVFPANQPTVVAAIKDEIKRRVADARVEASIPAPNVPTALVTAAGGHS